MNRYSSFNPQLPRATTGRLRLHIAIAAAVAMPSLALTAPTTLAQSRPDAGVLEEIVVTARRREESLQDVPIAVTAVDEDYLRTQNITSLEDMGSHVPAFRVSQGASTNTTIISLRGQRPVEVLLTLDPAVPLYFGEVVLTPTHGTNLALYDLQDVQVLKGPQGTLFGRNSTGGAVLVTPKTPGEELGGYADVKLGDYNLVHLEGAVDVPVSDSLKFRLAGRSLERDGYQDNVADNELRCNDCFWDEDSYGLRLSMEFTPTDELRNLTVVSRDKNDMKPRLTAMRAFNRSGPVPSLYNAIHNGGLAGINPLLMMNGLPPVPSQTLIDDAVARQTARGGSGLEAETDINGREVVENTLVINTTELEINDNLSIKNIIGYREMDYFAANDQDGSAVRLFGAPPTPAGGVTFDPSGEVTDAKQWSEEFQLIGTAFDEKLDWIAGAYWMEMEGSTYYETTVMGTNPDWPTTNPMQVVGALAPFLGLEGASNIAALYYLAGVGLPQIYDYDAVNEARALFGEATYRWNDQWSFTAGVRQSWDPREMTTRQRSTTGQCQIYGSDGQLLPDNACFRTEDKEFSSPTWRLAASYTPTDSQLLFGSISTGYRAGGFNSRGLSDVTLQPFDEETALNYEVGYKADWQVGDVAVRTNLAVFLQDYDDIQKTQDVTVGTDYSTSIVNAAAAEIRGGELEITVIPSANLELSLAYSLVDASYKEWILPTYLGVDNQGNALFNYYDNSNGDFTYIPENSMTGQIRYQLPLDAALGEMSLMASVYWQDEMVTNEEYARWSSYPWLPSDLENGLAWTKLDGYTLWNVRADWRNVMGSQFDLAVYSNNVTDEEYELGAQTVYELLGLISTTPGAPRTVGLSLRYNF